MDCIKSNASRCTDTPSVEPSWWWRCVTGACVWCSWWSDVWQPVFSVASARCVSLDLIAICPFLSFRSHSAIEHIIILSIISCHRAELTTVLADRAETTWATFLDASLRRPCHPKHSPFIRHFASERSTKDTNLRRGLLVLPLPVDARRYVKQSGR